MDQSSSCQSCGQPITKDELAEGLAVRVDGRLVCSACVDQLPGEAQVRINQLRAVRGLAATTYRLQRSAHPRLAAFTFTTSINMNLHRRELAASGSFDAPLLPAGAPKLVKPLPPRPLPTAWRPSPKLLAAGAGAVVVAGVAFALALHGGGAPTAAPIPAPSTTVRAPVTPDRARTEYAADPDDAWREAAGDPRCPVAVLQTIAGELVTRQDGQIAVVERALEAGDVRAAVAALDAVGPLPDHLLFRTAHKRAGDLTERIRMARIAATQAPAPAPVVPPPAPAVPDPVVPPPVVAVPEALPVPPPALQVPPAAAPAPAVPADDTSDCLAFGARQLSELPGASVWKTVGTDGLELRADSGSLVGSPTLQGGTYQLWVRARGSTVTSTLQVIIAGRRCQPTQLPKVSLTQWVRVEPATYQLPAGPVTLQLVMMGGGGSALTEVYLAGATRPPPAEARQAGLTTLPVFAGAGPAPAAAAPPTTEWIPRYAEPHPTIDLAVEALRQPNNPADSLPGNAGPVLESTSKGRTSRHGFTLDFTAADVQGGGIAVLVCPRRDDRTTLTATAIDGDGRRTSLDNLVLSRETWQAHAIDLSRVADARQLVIEDASPFTTSFLLAKAAASAGAAPTPALLGLRPPALLPLAARRLDDQLTFLAGRRRAPAWRKSFDPTRVKVLIGQKLTAGTWDTDLRRRLGDILSMKRLPNRTIEPLVLNDAWLDALVKPAAADDAVLDPAKHHVVIICTAGIEFPTGLSERQAFANLWRKLLGEIQARGILPVPVLGPSKVDGEDRAEVEKLWSDLAGLLSDKQPGVPVIDLRPAEAVSADRFAPGAAKLSVDLLGDGYADLLHRIEALRKAGK